MTTKLYKYYDKGEQDIINIEIQFNNGEHLLLPDEYIKILDIDLIKIDKVVGDPIFKYGFVFNTAYLEVDKLYLQQVLGSNDLYDKLNYRNGINSLVVYFKNEGYKIKSDIPLLLCLYKQKATRDYMIDLKYTDTEDSFIISWERISAVKGV